MLITHLKSLLRESNLILMLLAVCLSLVSYVPILGHESSLIAVAGASENCRIKFDWMFMIGSAGSCYFLLSFYI